MIKKHISLGLRFLLMMILCFQLIPLGNAVDGVVISQSGIPQQLEAGDEFCVKLRIACPAYPTYTIVPGKSIVVSANGENFTILKQQGHKVSQDSPDGNLIFELNIHCRYDPASVVSAPTTPAAPASAGQQAQAPANDIYGTITPTIHFRNGETDEPVTITTPPIRIHKQKSKKTEEPPKSAPQKPQFSLEAGPNPTITSEKPTPYSFVVRNTNPEIPVKNVTIAANSSPQILFPNTNVKNISEMGPDSEYKICVLMQAAKDAKTGMYPVSWEVTGDFADQTGAPQTVKQTFITLGEVQVPKKPTILTLRAISQKEATEGSEISVKGVIRNESPPQAGGNSADYAWNSGAFNVCISLTPTAGGWESTEEVLPKFPKNMAPGDSNEVAFDIVPKIQKVNPPLGGVAPMQNPAGPTEPIPCAGKLVATFVDSENVEHTVSTEFSFKLKPAIPEPADADIPAGVAASPAPEPEQQQPKKGGAKKWLILGGCGIVVVIASVLVVKKIRAKRSSDEDEDI